MYVRNKKDDCDGHGAGRMTISESVFLNCRRETPRVQVGWVHVYNSLWIGGGDDGEGMIRVDPDNGAKPEILVEACNITDVEDAYENDDNGIGTIAESAVVMDDDSRDDADTAYAPSSLSWCVPPYDYDVVDASDPAAMQRIMACSAAATASAPPTIRACSARVSTCAAASWPTPKKIKCTSSTSRSSASASPVRVRATSASVCPTPAAAASASACLPPVAAAAPEV